MVDLLCHIRHLIAGHHAVFNELGIAGDGRQRSFQLVGNIGCEILTYGSSLQNILMLGTDFVSKGLELSVNRGLYGRIQIFCHNVQRFQKMKREKMS